MWKQVGVGLGIWWLVSLLPTHEERTAAAVEDLALVSYSEFGGDDSCGSRACRGHEAGWEWARDKGITEPLDCPDRRQSFLEGCEAYAGAVQEGAASRVLFGGETANAGEYW